MDWAVSIHCPSPPVAKRHNFKIIEPEARALPSGSDSSSSRAVMVSRTGERNPGRTASDRNDLYEKEAKVILSIAIRNI
ncbi:MAG: hypothetical protein ACYSSN_01590 [Planctomycetota bacterium]